MGHRLNSNFNIWALNQRTILFGKERWNFITWCSILHIIPFLQRWTTIGWKSRNQILDEGNWNGRPDVPTHDYKTSSLHKGSLADKNNRLAKKQKNSEFSILWYPWILEVIANQSHLFEEVYVASHIALSHWWTSLRTSSSSLFVTYPWLYTDTF